MEENKDRFSYSYSAENREELKKIREKYAPSEEDKLQHLLRLDKSVSQKATAWSIVVGVIGALIMGIGMSLAMTDIGSILGSDEMALLVGIIVGVIGLALVVSAYPIYLGVLKRERAKVAPEIIKITDELMK